MPRRRSANFRLFDLPIVPIERIFSLLGVQYLFDFSLSSSKSKKIISGITTLRTLRVNVWIAENQKSISIFTCPATCQCKNPDVFWDFRCGNRPSAADFQKNGKNKIVEKILMKVIKRPNGFYHMRRSARDSRLFGAVLNHFLSTFQRCHVAEVYFFIDNVHPIRTVLGKLKSCETLKLAGNSHVENEDLYHILYNINISKKFDMDLRSNDSFRIENVPFFENCDEIYIEQALWVQRAQLLSLNCQKAKLLNATKLKDADLMEFVRNWYNKKEFDELDKKFTQLQITMRRGRDALDLSEFGATEWAPERRGEFFKLFDDIRLDCSNGMDFERPADGLLATVLIKNSRFYFVIWHDRFPNTDNCSQTYQ